MCEREREAKNLSGHLMKKKNLLGHMTKASGGEGGTRVFVIMTKGHRGSPKDDGRRGRVALKIGLIKRRHL